MESRKLIGILSIIFGLIMIVCPFAGLTVMSWIFAIGIILLGIYAIVNGTNGGKNWALIILGILIIIFGIIMFCYPPIFRYLIAFVNYLLGIVLILLSIVNVFTGKGDAKFMSIVGIIFGICCLIIGYCVSLNIVGVVVLAIVFGVWFIMDGILKVALTEEQVGKII